MRTTIDLPDDLLRQAKARAALDGLKLKDLIARYVARGLAGAERPPAGDTRTERQRSPLPVIPRASTGKPIPALSNAELAQIELEEDLAKLDLLDP
ncbi:MAG: hypothetical protein M3436_07805 [Pseudomonadota bacterium]|nr:hypothetical protein [Pseudomonadota bacterium]